MAIPPPHPDQDLLDRWSARIDATLGELLPGGTRVALVNFPNHANAGDSAIWLGAKAALARLGAVVAYQASWATYEPEALRRALGAGTVLLQGGGNFGDLYPDRQQATRERVLAELTDLPVLQLPQSLHFQDPVNLDRMRRLCEGHPDFTLLVREHASLAYAAEHFAVPTRLCPDLALALPTRTRAWAPRVDVLHLARVDQEAVTRPPTDLGDDLTVERVDWLVELDDEPVWPRADEARLALNRRLLDRSAADPAVARRTWRASAATFDALALRWVDRAEQVLSRGRVVRTDRLHAHLLSLLLGIPHVVEDNATGKVGAYVEAWTKDATLTRFAATPEEARDGVRALLGGPSPRVERPAPAVPSPPGPHPPGDRMDDRFVYLYDRIRDAEFRDDPFPHLHLDDFLSEEHLDAVLAAKEVALPPADDLDELFERLDEAKYERIDFPGCARSKEEYVAWLADGAGSADTNPNCEAQGLAFRLGEAGTEIIGALDDFFHAPELTDLLVEKFGLTLPVTMEGGVQKYLHGYEISPHPDIRKKALTWMLNVNPMPASEDEEFHTHYMRLTPERAYIAELWRANPTVETCWLPWAWCETVARQTANNSIVFFSPGPDTLHGVRAHYDHLPAQRTQFYGNLWYDPADLDIRIRPGHEDLDFVPRPTSAGAIAVGTRDVAAGADPATVPDRAHERSIEDRLADAEARAAAAEARLAELRANPAMKLGRSAKHLVDRVRHGRGG